MAVSEDSTGSGLRARKAVWAALAGTTLEWYDFFLFGTAAALVFDERGYRRFLCHQPNLTDRVG